uniref:Phospholipase B-like n=1 Tax=Caenorhabditis tropicalis TaxID=1561998 RepID=A0A1I7UGQ3_9PELO
MKTLILLAICSLGACYDGWTFSNTTDQFGGILTSRTRYLAYPKPDLETEEDVILPWNPITGNADNSLSDDDLKTIDDVFDVTNDVLEVGAAIKPLEKILGPLAALGELIRRLLHVGKRGDPVMDKLNSISHQIDMLGQKMSQDFADMKAFITEAIFDAEIVQGASTLNKFMQDTVAFPGNESISMFYQEYQRNPPIELGYKLMSYLEQPRTNPLVQAMAADPLKKTVTFDKWSSKLLNVMFQFFYIETYANGLFDNSTLYGPHRLEDKLQKLNETILEYAKHYKSNYWPSVVQKLVEDTQNQGIHYGNDRKAQEIRDAISQIMQDDIYTYFVIVYNNVKGYRNHAIGGSDYLYSYNLGNCNAAVMRTRRSRNPNSGVDHELQTRDLLKRHHKNKKNRCLKMLQDADKTNPSSTANAFIFKANPAVYSTGPVAPGRVANGWHTTWISTY